MKVGVKGNDMEDTSGTGGHGWLLRLPFMEGSRDGSWDGTLAGY